MSREVFRRFVPFLLVLLVASAEDGLAQVVIDADRHHLGTAGRPEWREFAGADPEGRGLELRFEGRANPAEATLLIRQRDVKLGWDVRINDRRIGQLHPMEAALVHALAVPAGTLRDGGNRLTIGLCRAAGRDVRDAEFARLLPGARARPTRFRRLRGHLARGADGGDRIAGLKPQGKHVPPMTRRTAGPVPLRVELLDAESGRPIPARVYLRGEDGSWHFPESEAPEGSAVPYRKAAIGRPDVVEMHTDALGPPVRRPPRPRPLHPDGRARQGVSPRDARGRGRRRAGPADDPAPPLDRHGRPRLVLGRHARPPHAGRAARRHARRGPQRRLPADRLGARGVRPAGRAPPGRLPRPRPRADPRRRDARHRPPEHRVRDLHRRQEAAHPRRLLRAQPPDRARPGRAAGRPRRPAGPRRGGADRAGQAQLALVDGAGPDHARGPVRAGEQPRLADRVRLPRLRRAAGRVHAGRTRRARASRSGAGSTSASRTTTPCSTAASGCGRRRGPPRASTRCRWASAGCTSTRTAASTPPPGSAASTRGGAS